MKVCGVCGKRIAVMWPEFYVYKHGKGEDTTYYCSENCMIVADTREMKDRIGWVDPQAEMTEEEIEAVTHGRPVGFRRLRKTARRGEQPAAPAGQEREDRTMAKYASSHKLTREEKERAVELAISGGDPLDWLRTCGAKNPSAAWFYIKKTVAKADPKLYEKIPEKPGMVINESGQAVPVGIKQLPEKFEGGVTAQITDEAAEWTPPVPADDPEAADPLEGFEAVDVGQQKAPEADLTIKAEDIQAAMDPAVERMEQIVTMDPAVERMEQTVTMEPKPEAPRDRAKRILDDLFRFPENVTAEQNPAGRVVLDKDGAHVEPSKEPKKPDWEKTTFFGIPCEVTALKIDDFEFAKDREGMRAVLPGGTILWGSTVSTPAIMAAEQWKRLAEIIPKVMKILRIE